MTSNNNTVKTIDIQDEQAQLNNDNNQSEGIINDTNTDSQTPEQVNYNNNIEDKLNVVAAPPVGVHFKNKRKFHDAWAFVAWFISIATIVGFGIYNIVKFLRESKGTGDIYFIISSESTKHFWKVVLLNFVIVLGIDILAVLSFAFIPKQVIIGGFICGPAIALGWMIYGILQGIDSYQTAVNAGGFVVALLGFGIAYYFLRNMLDTIAVLLKVGGRIVLRNILSVLTSYFVFMVLSIVIGAMIIYGFIALKSFSVLVGVLGSLFYVWTTVFFTYLFDVFTAGIVTGTVIKNTPRDQEEREMKVGGCAVVNTLWAMGTASFASLIIGLLNIMKQSVEGNAHSRIHEGLGILIIRFILSMLVSFLEQLVEAINKFALCYTAITGEGFVNSVKESWGCIKDGGFIAFDSYYAVEYAVYFINFLASLIVMGANYGYYRSFMQYEEFSISMLIFDIIISSASNSLAFIFVLDRERVKQYNVELYTALSKVALKGKENEKRNTTTKPEWPFFELTQS